MVNAGRDPDLSDPSGKVRSCFGISILNGRSLSEGLAEFGSATLEDTGEPKPVGKYVLIYTNEGQLEYQGPSVSPKRPTQISLPMNFGADAKQHQQSGFRWLRINYELGRSGCLLADDMGLGKTLQVLLFLASVIEAGEISDKTQDRDLPPWNPILVVAPVILIENGTWEAEMRSFFKTEGAIFDPYLILHGRTIMRCGHVVG